MGFNFSAVQALLGGYPDRRIEDKADRRHRSFQHRQSSEAAVEEPASTDAARLPGHPVTGGTGHRVTGIGRALDALMAAEETRRRRSRLTDDPDNAAAMLSTTLRSSLPKHMVIRPTDGSSGPAPVMPHEGPRRNWDEIRDLIDALAIADRSSQIEDEQERSKRRTADMRPWRPASSG